MCAIFDLVNKPFLAKLKINSWFLKIKNDQTWMFFSGQFLNSKNLKNKILFFY